MNKKFPTPTPRFTVITLGVSDMRASIAFYEALGFVATHEGMKRPLTAR